MKNKVQMVVELFEGKREVEKLNALGDCLMQEGLILQKVGNVINIIGDKEQADELLKRLKEISKEMAKIKIEMQIHTANLHIDAEIVEGKPEDLN